MKTNCFLFLALALCPGPAALFAQAPASRPLSFFQYLAPGEATALELSTDVSALMAGKKTNTYQPGVLTTAGGKSFAVEVRPRGKFRRKIAPVPPLKVKTKKKLLLAEGLDTLNEVKLALPCYLDQRGDELVIKEYLIYRMFEAICPSAARAQLVNLTLINTGTGNEAKYTVKAILLEDEEEIASRLNGTVVESYGMTIDSLEPDQAALTAVFQYMVGNTDWNIAEQRNVRFIRGQNDRMLLIPFDFDFAGFVNAPYATPTAGLGLRSVREHYLMADGFNAESIKRAFRKLTDHQPDFINLCRSGALSPTAARSAASYIETFFTDLLQAEKGK